MLFPQVNTRKEGVVLAVGKMDEDECLSIILSMGFPNIEEIKKALRFAKNDVNEAVSTSDHILDHQYLIDNPERHITFGVL